MTMKEMITSLSEYDIKAERKSIYDDIEALKTYGLDIENGKDKGDYRYYVNSRLFEMPELKLLVDAVQSSKFITYKKSEQLIKKVESLASNHDAHLLQRQVYVNKRIKTMNESIYYNVDKIHTAISEGKKISCLYFEWQINFEGKEKVKKNFKKNGERYLISPWSLTWDNENYYLIAFDSSANCIKHYRVDKMSDIRVENVLRDGQETFEKLDMAVYSQKVFGMFGGTEETVSLKFVNGLIGVVIDRFGADIFLRKEDESHFIVTTKAENSPQFLAWVFALGSGAQILSPENVKRDFLNMIESAKKLYQE